MSLSVQWSVELVTAINLVPRLEDNLIDDLFYQEDEIGEMRHTAFMIECGLEEDPPDGPDVPPLPWGDMLLQQQRFQPLSGSSRHSRNDSDSECNSSKQRRRELPTRSRSSDAMKALELELNPSREPLRGMRRPIQRARSSQDEILSPQQQPSRPVRLSLPSPTKPKRNNSVDSSDIISMRNLFDQPERPERGPRKTPPARNYSTDNISNVGLSLSFAKTERAKKSKSRSGTSSPSYESRLNQYREEEEVMALDDSDHRPKGGRSAPLVRKMMATKSGTPHELRSAANKAVTEFLGQTNDDNNDSECKGSGRKAPLVRKMMAVKSGSPHELRSAAAKAQAEYLGQTNGDNDDSESERKGSGRKAPLVRKMMAVKSGTPHELRSAAAKAQAGFLGQANDEDGDSETEPPRSSRKVPVPRKILAVKSGTPHGMRNKSSSPSSSNGNSSPTSQSSDNEETRVIYKNGKKTIVKNTSMSLSNHNNSCHNDIGYGSIRGRRASLSSLSRTKSNNSECSRERDSSIIYKNGKKIVVQQNRPSLLSRSGSISDDDFLDDVVSSDDDSDCSSDISISTCGSAIEPPVTLASTMTASIRRDPVSRRNSGSPDVGSSSPSALLGRKIHSKSENSPMRSPLAVSRKGYTIQRNWQSEGSGRSPNPERPDSITPLRSIDTKKKKKKKKTSSSSSEDDDDTKDAISANSMSSEKKKKKKDKEKKPSSKNRSKESSTSDKFPTISVMNIRERFESVGSSPPYETVPGTPSTSRKSKKSPKNTKSTKKLSPLKSSSEHNPIRAGDWVSPFGESTPKRGWKVKKKAGDKLSGEPPEEDRQIPPAFRAKFSV